MHRGHLAPTPDDIPEPSDGILFLYKSLSVHVMKGVSSLLTDVFLNRHFYPNGIQTHICMCKTGWLTYMGEELYQLWVLWVLWVLMQLLCNYSPVSTSKEKSNTVVVWTSKLANQYKLWFDKLTAAVWPRSILDIWHIPTGLLWD